MLIFLSSGETLPFVVALTIMMIIALLEGVSTLLGAGFSSVLETLVPDMDLGLDAPDMESPSAFFKALGWLRVGQVPLLMLLVILLTAFGLIGLSLQAMAQAFTGSGLPLALAVLLSGLLSLPVVRVTAGLLNRVMPKDETEAVSAESFIGRTAVITLGSACKGKPAQAKLRDQHGLWHYILVEPDLEHEQFAQHQSVLVVRKSGAVYSAIANTHEALQEQV